MSYMTDVGNTCWLWPTFTEVVTTVRVIQHAFLSRVAVSKVVILKQQNKMSIVKLLVVC